MRRLPYCEVYTTDHHPKASTALAEALIFVQRAEGVSQAKFSYATIIDLDIGMDDNADYWVQIVIERTEADPPPIKWSAQD